MVHFLLNIFWRFATSGIQRKLIMARLKRNSHAIEPLQKDDFAAYFEFCLSEGDSELIVAALGDIARAHGMSLVAKESGLSEEYLCQILSDEGNPKFSTIAKVVKALGLKLYAGSPMRGNPQSLTQDIHKGGVINIREPRQMLSQRLAINEAINKSGRQRMLSQQLAKCYLQIGQSIDTTRSKQIFEASLALFEQQLIELKVFAPTQDIKAVLTNLEQAWGSYKNVLVDASPNQRDAKLVLTINEDILVMAQESTDQLEKYSRTAAGKVVNLAGRQRMLSQRMAKFYQALNWGVATPDTMARLAAARREFMDSLAVLTGFSKNTPDIRSELEVGKQQWAIFDKALNSNFSSIGKKSLVASNVATLSERLLEVMDRVTCLYTRLA
jgi:probable addiction module antidote protein